MRRSWWLVVLAGVGALLPLAAQPVPPPRPLATPQDALLLAWDDLQKLPEHDRPFMRYVWVQDSDPEGFRDVSLALNTVSRASSIRRPLPIAGARALVVRLDLRLYAPREADLKVWLGLWEDFRYDPSFSLLLTRGTLVNAGLVYPEQKVKTVAPVAPRKVKKIVDVPPYQHTDGRWYSKKEVEVVVPADGTVQGPQEVSVREIAGEEVLRLPGQHLDQRLYSLLCQETHSQAPVVSDLYALNRMLRTIRDDGAYAVIYGGRYYDFAGIPLAGARGSDEDALLQQLGVGNVEAGVTAQKIFAELRSDRRVAVFRSGVTGGPRRMDFFRTLTGAVDDTSSLISFSHDLKQKQIGIEVHPMANLLDFRDDAREVIYERANGLHGYGAYDGKGKRQNEVPADVANDRTIPSPHPPRLEAALSCIACHETEGSDGWKAVTNDVKKLVGLGKRLDVFGDFAAGKQRAFSADVQDRLVGLYNGDPERALVRARDDYARAVLAATGPWQEAADKAQVNVVKVATKHLVDRLRKHRYDLVTPRMALESLGAASRDDREALVKLNELLPPDLRAAVVVPGQVEPIILEDPRIAALKADIPIGRYDWDQAFSFAADRAQRALAARRGK